VRTIKHIFLLISFLTLFACQKEEVVVVENPTENLTSNSELVELIEQITQNPTNEVDIIDDSECYNVLLPVKIELNGEYIEINTKDDYIKINNSKIKTDNDDDKIDFIFPITLQYPDYQIKEIYSKEELRKINDDCTPKSEDDNMDCVKINFPITINTYDSENQKAKTITINDNKTLYNFLKNLDSKILISINYPIAFKDADGKNVTVNNNADFNSLILENLDECKKK
jgi:hypothetical protein